MQIGQQLGSYEITSLLGKGGQGEVYRARDSKLKRDVAIKILPDEFSRDPDRVSRFQREAEALAALNHPNIGAIYDLQEANGSRFLVLELVEGDTLADILRKRGTLPLNEALKVAQQVCKALQAAHETGIVHRDLKPANIKITPEGGVKLLDFGLARVFADAAASDLSNSPTLMSRSTPGMILGTAAYMSPEQARGEEVDWRTDIWAFGCVLYQMLAGRTVFAGKTITELLGAIIHKDIDWTALPASTPAGVRGVLRRCLQKDLDRRLHDIADARIEIEEVGTPGPPGEVAAPPARRVRVAWFAATLAMTVVGLLAIPAVVHFREAPPPEIRVEVNTPPTNDSFSFAISPDGRRLVFSASSEGKSQLWVRPLDSLALQPLAGTDGASFPFWSPDSASVGFFADGKLKRIDIVGGAPQVLANANNGQGGAWNRDGTILFAPSSIGSLLKVPATGGEPVAATRLETGQAGHKFPQFLPDSRHFIYFVQSGTAQGVYAGSLDGASSKRLANADASAVVSPSGFLLFPRQTTLLAQTFDFKKQELSGNPFPVAEQVAGFSATSDIVAYRTGSAGAARQLTWLDRSGKNVDAIGAPDVTGLTDVELSPDGKRVAVTRTVNGNPDVWLIDAARGVPTRFTFDAANDDLPIWSPDGSRVMFQSNRKGVRFSNRH